MYVCMYGAGSDRDTYELRRRDETRASESSSRHLDPLSTIGNGIADLIRARSDVRFWVYRYRIGYSNSGL